MYCLLRRQYSSLLLWSLKSEGQGWWCQRRNGTKYVFLPLSFSILSLAYIVTIPLSLSIYSSCWLRVLKRNFAAATTTYWVRDHTAIPWIQTNFEWEGESRNVNARWGRESFPENEEGREIGYVSCHLWWVSSTRMNFDVSLHVQTLFFLGFFPPPSHPLFVPPSLKNDELSVRAGNRNLHSRLIIIPNLTSLPSR